MADVSKIVWNIPLFDSDFVLSFDFDDNSKRIIWTSNGWSSLNWSTDNHDLQEATNAE